jgi:glyoxylase-like metal-dependent hydrolase (beta-lactamase superfamily II)
MAEATMPFDITFKTKYCGSGVYAVSAPMGEQIYLVTGVERAAVIDTGMGIGSLKAAVNSITELPLIIINTHGHPDHAGGNAEFDTLAYMHPADNGVYNEMCTAEFRVSDIRKVCGMPVPKWEDAIIPFTPQNMPLSDKQEFDLGGRSLTVSHLPGHTYGSVVLYDKGNGILFSGDALTSNETWLYLDYSTTLEVYHNELVAFAEKKLEIASVFSGHLPIPTPAAILDDMISLTQKILDGEIAGEPFETFAGKGLRAERKTAKIIYNPERLR